MMNQALLPPKNADRQFVYSGIDWQQFKLIQAGFADASGVRLAYFNNTIEILMPGRTHELFKSIIGMLIELFRQFDRRNVGSILRYGRTFPNPC
ncbi:hypothetical protein [Chamaesiphon sp. OTE_20_metabat_361]|uniref:hypothetical protein n=1 Tax=Chamaesiphon sp. OTE_20_metabat_361 TaxID=2964689 RepID=UPI00286D68E0|nr:hypothetical protein [Chamaesiphon sp. OTE_20_metabat_361]